MSFHNRGDIFRTIYSDQDKIIQIFTNLINNAVKFSESGCIKFGYEMKADFIQFYVEDTEIGIKKDLHVRIFDRFFQAELALTRGYEGAGLGLSICKGLGGLLGGSIWVESEIKKGTTFFFTLPSNPQGLVS